MFWKKLLNRKNEKNTRRLYKPPTEIRKSFRVCPSPNAPIHVKVNEKTVPVIDISSGGMCFRNQGFQGGAIYEIRFHLPNDTEEIQSKLKILRIEKDDLCRCQFIDLGEDQENRIHYFVLTRQKEELAEKRKQSA